MGQYLYSPTPLLAILLTPLVEAGLPWNSHIANTSLKKTDVVSFDPLSLLAILWNPRASTSAARLYTQQSRPAFRWPHMLQIGCVLTPVGVLVNHLTLDYQSIHPAVSMYMANVVSLAVKKSNIGSVNAEKTSLFPELPVDVGDDLLMEALNFKPSRFAANDMMVVHVKAVASDRGDSGGGGGGGRDGAALALAWSHAKKGWLVAKLVLATELGAGVVAFAGTVFSALLGDMWAVTLFATYAFHWLASTAISFRQLIIPDPNLTIKQDPRFVFAVYERPSGGAVIFKGRQDVMERWARMKWVFNNVSVYNICIHWLWISTGAAAAFTSVACMVNMGGYMQLGFLGLLLYSSAAELWLTILTRKLQTQYADSRDFECVLVGNNEKRYQSIIHATLGLEEEYRLDKMRWINLGLLPSMQIFQAMVNTMDYLNDPANELNSRLVRARDVFDDWCVGMPERDWETRDGIWAEIEKVWNQRNSRRTSSTTKVPQV
ncbi:MAG: hypothetical protein M1816_007397 [Peltula sp. TS41687]|nr:MAG: hypothetical protein M1816_007397 [Peltula sp. TS41687]